VPHRPDERPSVVYAYGLPAGPTGWDAINPVLISTAIKVSCVLPAGFVGSKIQKTILPIVEEDGDKTSPEGPKRISNWPFVGVKTLLPALKSIVTSCGSVRVDSPTIGLGALTK
jgi:hypothetical protein